MEQSKLNEIAKKIIKNNIYLTLATSDGDPWAAPLFYAVDNEFNFYFISQMDCVHVKHILKNHKVAFAIFDSHQKEGEGNGVQGSGEAFLMKDNELDTAFKWYQTTYVPMKKESFSGKAPYRFFKLVTEKFYVLDPDADVDKRVEVKIK